MFWKTRWVCAAISPSTICPVAGSIGTWPETNSSEPARMACEYGPIAFGRRRESRRPGASSGRLDDLARLQAARADTQTPDAAVTIARTRWRFGSNRRGVTLCAWLTFRPTTGPFSAEFAAFCHD